MIARKGRRNLLNGRMNSRASMNKNGGEFYACRFYESLILQIVLLISDNS